jgi:hypothetical protein
MTRFYVRVELRCEETDPATGTVTGDCLDAVESPHRYPERIAQAVFQRASQALERSAYWLGLLEIPKEE